MKTPKSKNKVNLILHELRVIKYLLYEIYSKEQEEWGGDIAKPQYFEEAAEDEPRMEIPE